MLSPCVKPILKLPCVTTFDRAVGMGKPPLLSLAPALLCPPAGAVVVSGMSKSPLTSCRSGARLRRKE